MSKNNQGILLFIKLISEVADVKCKLITPDDFAERSDKAYQCLLEELEGYLYEGDMYHFDRYHELKDKLEFLVARANAIISIHKEITADLEISPYRASLAMYMSMQLTEALKLIHPDNMKK